MRWLEQHGGLWLRSVGQGANVVYRPKVVVRGRAGIGAQATAARQATVIAAVVVPRPVPVWLPDPGPSHATVFRPAEMTA